jgi:hypothetical protein
MITRQRSSARSRYVSGTEWNLNLPARQPVDVSLGGDLPHLGVGSQHSVWKSRFHLLAAPRCGV